MSKLTYFKFLTESEVTEVRSTLHDMRNLWDRRHHSIPLFTLGAATYIDRRRYVASFYYAKAKLLNPILRERFGWLYEQLLQTLEEYLGGPIRYWDSLPLPGFKVFLGHEVFATEFDLSHYDEQQYMLPESERVRDGYLDKQLTFTLPIALPKSGSGLEMWDLHAKETQGLSKEDKDRLLLTRRKQIYSYKAGELVCHSGLYYHRIPPIRDIQPDDERITLQGHGIFYQGSWRLYW